MIRSITYCKRCKSIIGENETSGKFGEHGTKFDKVDVCQECEHDINDRWDKFSKVADLLKKDNAAIADITPDSASLAGNFTVAELKNIINFMEWWKNML